MSIGLNQVHADVGTLTLLLFSTINGDIEKGKLHRLLIITFITLYWSKCIPPLDPISHGGYIVSPFRFFALEPPILMPQIVVQFLFHIDNEYPESWELKGVLNKLKSLKVAK